MLTSALKKNSEGYTLPLSFEFSTIKSKNKGRPPKKEKQRKGLIPSQQTSRNLPDSFYILLTVIKF